MNTLLIQLYADCAMPDAAQAIAQNLLSALQAYGPQLSAAPSPYWKIPALYGFELALHPASEAAFHALVAAPRRGWTHGGDDCDRSSVWNHAEGGAYFLVLQARWAEVQFSVRDA
jgi:hypothetical protein